jgi:hypothetical protein
MLIFSKSVSSFNRKARRFPSPASRRRGCSLKWEKGACQCDATRAASHATSDSFAP